VCQASPPIARFAGADPIPDMVLAPLVNATREPGFTVDLPTKILEPFPEFTPDKAIVRYEICLAFCDHPFRDEGGADHDSWLTAPQCIRNSVP